MGNTQRLIQIPAMPGLWDYADMYVGKNDILGSLAKWGVRLSPYTYPNDLNRAMDELEQALPDGENRGDACLAYRMNAKALGAMIHEAIAKCATIMNWNNRKSGAKGPGFVTRYSKPDPDNDFIDIDALVRNIVHDIVLEHAIHDAQDEKDAIVVEEKPMGKCLACGKPMEGGDNVCMACDANGAIEG